MRIFIWGSSHSNISGDATLLDGKQHEMYWWVTVLGRNEHLGARNVVWHHPTEFDTLTYFWVGSRIFGPKMTSCEQSCKNSHSNRWFPLGVLFSVLDDELKWDEMMTSKIEYKCSRSSKHHVRAYFHVKLQISTLGWQILGFSFTPINHHFRLEHCNFSPNFSVKHNDSPADSLFYWEHRCS
jgi:hypothetical protein